MKVNEVKGQNIRFEASCSSYAVVVVNLGANTLIADETARWAAYVPTRTLKNAEDLANEIFANTSRVSILDCENIAKAVNENSSK